MIRGEYIGTARGKRDISADEIRSENTKRKKRKVEMWNKKERSGKVTGNRSLKGTGKIEATGSKNKANGACWGSIWEGTVLLRRGRQNMAFRSKYKPLEWYKKNF
jgi:hypothetical protein